MPKLKKTHTVDDVDAATAESFILGMHEAYNLLEDVLLLLQGSIRDVQGIYSLGDGAGAQSQQGAELQVAFDTLTKLQGMMAEAYDSAVEFNKDALHVELDRASLAAFKEEWPL